MLLKENLIYWLFRQVVYLSIVLVLISFTYMFFDFYLKRNYLIAVLGYFLIAIWSYLKNILFKVWEITENNLIVKKGVFFKTVDYIELYRIYDYKETQNLIQYIFAVKTISLYSTDHTDSVLYITNVSSKYNIVDIRNKVEKMKNSKRVLEVIND